MIKNDDTVSSTNKTINQINNLIQQLNIESLEKYSFQKNDFKLNASFNSQTKANDLQSQLKQSIRNETNCSINIKDE